MAHGDGSEVVYLTMEDFYDAAAEALGADLATVRSITNETLAGSAIAAPSAGFGDFEQSLDFAAKAAVLLQAVASNHALPDGNKRSALLCAIAFATVNGYRWVPPSADEPDGTETAEVVEAASTRSIPLGALSAWVEFRLDEVPLPPPERLSERPPLVIYPAEYVGGITYADHTIEVGDLKIHDVHGYNPAGVYVRRISGKTDGISVAEIIITAVGDRYSQEELDAENAEAQHIRWGSRSTGVVGWLARQPTGVTATHSQMKSSRPTGRNPKRADDYVLGPRSLQEASDLGSHEWCRSGRQRGTRMTRTSDVEMPIGSCERNACARRFGDTRNHKGSTGCGCAR